MLYYLMSKLFTQKQTVPESYLRMMRNEFKSVNTAYVEFFLEKNNRLPTPEELLHAI